jgi:plastocyanin
MKDKTLLRRLALVPLLVAPALSVTAVTVKGKVVNTDELINAVWNEAKDPKENRFAFREPVSTVPPDKRKLRGHLSKELCVAVLVESPPAPQKKKHTMTIEGGRTSPVMVVIPPGDEIEFANKDPFEHNVYEVSGKGGFGEGNMLEKGTRAWTPPGPGKYEIRDKLAPSLRSWVVVEPKVLKTFYPNRKGDFFGSPTDLDPGSYTLRAYFGGEAVGDALPIDIKPAPPEQTLDKPLKAAPDPAKDDKKDDKKEPGKGGG